MSEIKFDLDSLKESYKEASKDIQFRRLVKTIKASTMQWINLA